MSEPGLDVRTSLKSRNLSAPIGAEVLEVDLSGDLDPALMRELITLWEERSMLVFRNQRLDEDAHVRFVSHFGDIQTPMFKTDEAKAFAKHPLVVLISNVRLDGKLAGAVPDGELMFHSDYSYRERTGKASCLYAVEVPDRGGETRFASATAAYEDLSDDMKTRLDGLWALHVYSTDGHPKPDSPRAVHPVVTTHPGTGRKVLFVGRLTTTMILGLPKHESDALLAELFDHQEQTRYIYDHPWQPGDLVIWDNRSCLHARTDFDPNQRRLLKRVSTLT